MTFIWHWEEIELDGKRATRSLIHFGKQIDGHQGTSGGHLQQVIQRHFYTLQGNSHIDVCCVWHFVPNSIFVRSVEVNRSVTIYKVIISFILCNCATVTSIFACRQLEKSSVTWQCSIYLHKALYMLGGDFLILNLYIAPVYFLGYFVAFFAIIIVRTYLFLWFQDVQLNENAPYCLIQHNVSVFFCKNEFCLIFTV